MIDVSNAVQRFWQGEGFAAGLGWVWVAANLTIIGANASVAWTLYGTCRRWGTGLPASRWLITLLMALVALGALSHLGAVLSPPPDGRLGLTVFKAFAATAWALAAIRLPALTSERTAPLTIHPAPPPDERILRELAGRFRKTVRTLETIVHNEPCLLDRSITVRQLRDTLTEWEAQSCKI
jgi:hypothetical protein